MEKFILPLCAFLLAACHDAAPSVSVESSFVYTEASFPSCHASTIVESGDGTLVTAFFGGTAEGADDVCIYLSRKAPADTAWSAPVKVAEDADGPCWNPVLFKAADGRLLLFYKTSRLITTWVGHIKTSYDGGLTWDEGVTLPHGLLGAIKNKPVMLPGGRIVSPSSDESDGWKAHFELSDDDGRSWRKVGPIAAADSLFVIQPTIIRHGDGTLEALCRTQNSRLASIVSTDNGESWSDIELIDFPQNNSGLDTVTLPDGRFVMVCNPVGNNPGLRYGPRTPLCVFISKDARNWEKIATLEDDDARHGYCYPSVIYGSDGCLHIVYTWRRERIRYARISGPF